MIRNALLLCAALLAAATFACVAPPPPPPQARLFAASGGTMPLQHRANICHDADTFVSAVKVLDVSTPYYPDIYVTPKATAGVSLPQYEQDDLRAAYNAAPDFFRKHLCALDGIFIDPTSCSDTALYDNCRSHSWGVRNPSDGTRYIAISGSLWAGSNAPILTDYETKRLTFLLNSLNGLTWLAGTPYFDVQNSVVDAGNSFNTSAMTVLAALAHELGHIRWYDINVANPGGPHDLTNLLTCQNDGQPFYLDSWKYQNAKLLEPPRWRYFGDITIFRKLKHLLDPQVNDFLNAPNSNKLAQNLSTLYASDHPWASLLASLTPDEDFVETFEFLVLTYNASTTPTPTYPYVQSFRLNAPTTNAGLLKQDIPNDYLTYNKPTFSRKVSCVYWINSTMNFP
jgi:hypothetical protein